MNQYENRRAADFQQWNPDGSGLLIPTRFPRTDQVPLVSNVGADRRQLTFLSGSTEQQTGSETRRIWRWTEPEMRTFLQTHPIDRAHRISKTLLVIQGKNDPWFSSVLTTASSNLKGSNFYETGVNSRV